MTIKKRGIAAMAIGVCLASVLTGCNSGLGGVEMPTKTVPTASATTTVPTTTTTRTPTTTAASSKSSLLVNVPDGKTPNEAALAAIKSLCGKNYGKLSLYYKDLETGYSVEFCADQNYQAASVIKAPYIKYLLASGEADLTENLTFKTRKGGAAYIENNFKIGDTIPVKDVMTYTIRYSDNAGYWMLNRRYDFEGFRDYGFSLGCNPKQCTEYQFYYLTARECGLYFEDIARYIAQGSDKAQLLKSWLTTTEETRQIPDAFAGKYTVAHKYGEQGNQAYHDSAIVYAEHPYVLAILSTLEPYSQSSIATFHQLAQAVDDLQSGFYATGV